MKIKHKKLPNGWEYLVTIRQLKEFVCQSRVDVRLVEFTGPGGRPHKITAGLYRGGRLDARVDGGRWCFRFRFNGLPEEILPPNLAEFSQMVLSDMASFVSRSPDEPLDTTGTPEHRILFLRFIDGVLSADFTTKKQDGVDDKIEMYARNRWWEGSTQQSLPADARSSRG